MNLSLDLLLAQSYKSKSQQSRVVTESWIAQNMYCPICGASMLGHYEANRPVADFFCGSCESDYELKSKESKSAILKNTIPDGAYDTMIKRITSLNNPNLFVMTYYNNYVNNLIFVPNFFFVPDIIIKRPPLKESARRAGWVGCNINLGLIPDEAKIKIIYNGEVMSADNVVENYRRIHRLKIDSIRSRGWLIDTMSCINRIPNNQFTLKDIYAFESVLKIKYPDNHFIKDKLRQQLQILRDKGFIEFTKRGCYKKIL